MPSRQTYLNWKNNFGSVLLALTVLFAGTPSSADMQVANKDLQDEYLTTEFDWAMYLDVQDLKKYLSYQGSQMHPLTKVSVYTRSFPKDQMLPAETSKLFEEIWYRGKQPVGIRRFTNFSVPVQKIGALVVGKLPDGPDKQDSSPAVANALVRLLVELQVKQVLAEVALVPAEKYAEIGSALERYHFAPTKKITEGPQMSIRLRNYPFTLEETYYYQK